MCRWLSYRGPAIYLEELLYEPKHSLIDQSLHALEAKTPTNGDGFGVGWFGGRQTPGTYHEILPAWNDANLKSLAHQIHSNNFFAHVRASTGTATSRANCHPFSYRNWLFMHNGQVGEYHKLRRALESRIPDDLYIERKGTTDSEAIFYMMLGNGLEEDPVGAANKTLGQVVDMMDQAGIRSAFRMTSVFSDGERYFALRFSTDDKPPTLYYCDENDKLILVSEPLDSDTSAWKEVPPSTMLIAGNGNEVNLQPLRLQ